MNYPRANIGQVLLGKTPEAIRCAIEPRLFPDASDQRKRCMIVKPLPLFIVINNEHPSGSLVECIESVHFGVQYEELWSFRRLPAALRQNECIATPSMISLLQFNAQLDPNLQFTTRESFRYPYLRILRSGVGPTIFPDLPTGHPVSEHFHRGWPFKNLRKSPLRKAVLS